MMIIDLDVGKDGDVLDCENAKKSRGDRVPGEKTRTWCGVPGARPSGPSSMGLAGSVVHRQDWMLSRPRREERPCLSSAPPMALSIGDDGRATC
jgi:hypothetical protein